MKLVVNTRLLRKNQMDGIGWFAHNTMERIVKQNPKIEFHFLFDSGIEKEFLFSPNVIPHNLFPPAKHAVLNIAWFEISVKNLLRKLQPDLFLSPDGILCMGWEGKQYAVIHDINFLHNPEDLKWSNRKYYNYFFPKYAKKAARIATVSEYSKQDISQHYKIDPANIDVVYNGVNSFFHPIPAQEQERVKQKFTSGKDYFLFIGTLHPRKNITRLLEAFDLFKTATGSTMKLVVAGKNLYKSNEILERHEMIQSKADVVFTGRIEDDEINGLLASAYALSFVPTFEGFGIPIIEAMQCDVPVICSNTTSMPEVAGDAALLVDPFSVKQISDAMVQITADLNLRTSLIERGRTRKNYFSWDKTSSLLWDSILKCL